jgi:hypothetical protein
MASWVLGKLSRSSQDSSSNIDDIRLIEISLYASELFSLYVHDQACCLRESSNALAVHSVIHKCSPPFHQNEPASAQNFQVMRYGRLPDRKMFNDVANADWLIVRCQQVEYTNTDRIPKRFETTGVLLRTRLRKLGRLHLGATTGCGAFRVGGHCLSNQGYIINRQTSI